MSRWKTAKAASDLPPIPGCYVIYLGNKVIYVGSSVNLRTRMGGHHIRGNRICYRKFKGSPADILIKYRPSIKYGDWAMVELRLLKRLKPDHNYFHTGKKHKRPRPIVGTFPRGY